MGTSRPKSHRKRKPLSGLQTGAGGVGALSAQPRGPGAPGAAPSPLRSRSLGCMLQPPPLTPLLLQRDRRACLLFCRKLISTCRPAHTARERAECVKCVILMGRINCLGFPLQMAPASHQRHSRAEHILTPTVGPSGFKCDKTEVLPPRADIHMGRGRGDRHQIIVIIKKQMTPYVKSRKKKYS